MYEKKIVWMGICLIECSRKFGGLLADCLGESWRMFGKVQEAFGICLEELWEVFVGDD